MKRSFFAVLLLAVVLCSAGCATIEKELAKFPQIEAELIEAEITGRVTSTKGKLQDVRRLEDGRMFAGEVELDHSNPWLQRLHFRGVGVILPPPASR